MRHCCFVTSNGRPERKTTKHTFVNINYTSSMKILPKPKVIPILPKYYYIEATLKLRQVLKQIIPRRYYVNNKGMQKL